ncbi:zf-TFIIB domain-containing protein [Kitasatospora cineracea]|uniref:TFIIB-like protein n=1 Tax=Kitasatospora cineracea TaxID=88074 RepID=A0A8G1UH89_9ACTN|nr:zf-TFIIB domain-containing protein [Kitasatospora cineracea]ROR43004.1 TFIIB-like protein [Kitasatospora cineracea]
MTYPPAPSPRPPSCPRCTGPMAGYQRADVPVQYCERCTGVFLDLAALEQIVAVEAAARTAAPQLAHHAPHGPVPPRF